MTDSLKSVPKIWTADFGKLVAKHFEDADGERINLFACGATRYPDAQFSLSIFLFVFEQRRQETFFQGSEQRFIAKKARHVDEQIGKERFNFFFVVAQIPRVLAQLFDPMQRHPPVQSPNQRALLVTAEINTHLFFQRKKNPTQVVGLTVSFLFGFLCIG